MYGYNHSLTHVAITRKDVSEGPYFVLQNVVYFVEVAAFVAALHVSNDTYFR